MDLKDLLHLFAILSVGALVGAAGMASTHDDALYVFRHPKLLAKAVLSVNVIVPLAAIALTSLFPLEMIVRAGILLMAVSPVPPVIPLQEEKLGASKDYAMGLYVALAALSVIIVPVTVWVVSRLYGHPISVEIGALARVIVITMVVPLAVGMLIRRFAPNFAARVAGPLAKISFVLLCLAVLPLIVHVFPNLIALIGNGAVVVMIGIALVGLAAGNLLGGPTLRDRAALGLTSALRHPGIALLIAKEDIADKRVIAAIVLFLLVSAVLVLLYQIWLKRRYAAQAGA